MDHKPPDVGTLNANLSLFTYICIMLSYPTITYVDSLLVSDW